MQSSYEFGREKKRLVREAPAARTLVSNSLLTRKSWLEEYGGEGKIPSALQRRAQKGMEEVILLGAEGLDPKIWEAAENEL